MHTLTPKRDKAGAQEAGAEVQHHLLQARPHTAADSLLEDLQGWKFRTQLHGKDQKNKVQEQQDIR